MVFLPLFMSAKITPLASQTSFEKLLLIVYYVFLCDKTLKSSFFGQV